LITVLITGAGAAGTKGTLYSLRLISSRRILTVGVDINSDVVGKYLCDKFYKVPKPTRGTRGEFISKLLWICKREHVKVILPQVNEELSVLATYRDLFEDYWTKIAISTKEAIEMANSKYEFMGVARGIGVPTPKYYLVNTFTQLEKCMTKLGYPEKLVVLKPPVSRGMIGLRIVDESINRKKFFYAKKPDKNVYVKKEELGFLGERFPRLLVMEHLSGKEYSVDVLSNKENVFVVVPRTRDLIRTGITFNGTTEKNEEIMEYSEKLTKEMKLEYAHGYQFKLDGDGVPKVLECNPRIQGTMGLATFAGANIIYGAVKLCLGEKIPKFNVRWGTRLMRDWGAICVRNEKKVGEM